MLYPPILALMSSAPALSTPTSDSALSSVSIEKLLFGAKGFQYYGDLNVSVIDDIDRTIINEFYNAFDVKTKEYCIRYKEL